MQPLADNKAIYHTWIVVILWVLQMISEIIVVAVNGLRVGALGWVNSQVNSNGGYTTSCYYDSYGNTVCNATAVNTSYLGFAIAAFAIALTMGVIFFILHIVQVVKYAQRKLSPSTNFTFDCFRFVILSIILLLNIVAGALYGFSWLSLVFIILNWTLYLCSLIYASILYHRFRRGDYNNILRVQTVPHQLESQTVYPNKQEANYNGVQYQQPQ